MDGHAWPVTAGTVRRLLRRVDRERRARLDAERIAEEATRASLRDPLTGLPNRRRLLGATDVDGTASSSLAVLFVDLDRFKVVNDTWGHDAGDRALVEVARRLRRSVRPSDTVVRLGGDEFVCLCRGITTTDEALGVAERVRAELDELHRFEDGRTFRLAGTIGVALGDEGSLISDLVNDADSAVGSAKATRRGSVLLFDDEVRHAVRERIDLERELRTALDEHALQVHYQPVFELSSGAIHGVEALVRWHHPDRGWIPPSTFVPLAERAGIVGELDRFVLTRALEEAGSIEGLTISVNLSAIELTGAGIARDVGGILDRSGIDPRRVWLEITESAWLAPDQTAVSTVVALEQLGLRIAIDDFGTGHSALAHLQRLPVDAIKVDRSFVAGIVENERDAVIVQTVVAMADSLDLELVAEGVETEQQRAVLLDMGVRRAQGWLFAPALPFDELVVALTSPSPLEH